MKVLLPRVLLCDFEIDQPLFYLAGPILGGGDWQQKCCDEIARYLPNAIAAVPCRWEKAHPLYSYRITGSAGEGPAFDNQTAWERHYLKLAAERGRYGRGCIIFWLPTESARYPRDDGQPYARDTRFELGAWSVRAADNCTIKLVIGAQDDFPGLRTIKTNLALEFDVERYPVHRSLKETVAAAVSCITTV